MIRLSNFAACAVLALFAPRLEAQTNAEAQRLQIAYPWLRIGGFSDFNFVAMDHLSPRDPGAASGFREGQFVLHFTSALSPRFSYFAEISATAQPEAFAIEVERTILKFDAANELRLSFGRYHTPINYWNTAFHHGQWLQTTISRPAMVQFGGNFIPVHFVGALVEGVLPSGGLNLGYKAGVGNGRSSRISRGGDAQDVNNQRAWLGSLLVQPDRLYKLQIGGAVYHDRITGRLPLLPSDSLVTRDFPEWIASAYLVWLKETPEVLGEFAYIRHDDSDRPGGEVSHDNFAWYAQIGYRLPWWSKRWKPYARFERIDIDEADAVFLGVSHDRALLVDQQEYVAGLRCDVSDYVALKAEFRRDRFDGLRDLDALFLQTSFAF